MKTATSHPSSLLETTDWAAEWRMLQAARKQADDAAYWDERSKTFGMNDKPSDYAHDFLELAAVQPGESVFDMGCGNGALTLPLAKAGHQVLAVDFSRGMLDRLEHDAAAQDITGITTKLASWEDDWQAAGILPKSCDVTFASRSIVTADLRDSLERLSCVARRKCCITLSTSYSPRCDDRILREIGFERLIGRDFQYAVNILMQMGISPEVRYIKSARYDKYSSREEAWENINLMLDSALKAAPGHDEGVMRARLATWFEENLVEKPVENPMQNEPILQTSSSAKGSGARSKIAETAHANDGAAVAQTTYSFAKPRVVTWAFISWEVDSQA